MDRGDAIATIAFLRAGQIVAEVAVALDRPLDLEFLNRLATLQLAARRTGWSVEVRSAAPDLEDALDRTGLARTLRRR